MMKAVGSKAEVFHGTAKHTSGQLYKKDLMKRKGRIMSKKKHAAGKRAIKHLQKLGYKAKKGTFKLFKKSDRRSRKRGGAAGLVSGDTMNYAGYAGKPNSMSDMMGKANDAFSSMGI